MSISFHPDDNDNLTYDETFRIAKEFAEKFFEGYEVLSPYIPTPSISTLIFLSGIVISKQARHTAEVRKTYTICVNFSGSNVSKEV